MFLSNRDRVPEAAEPVQLPINERDTVTLRVAGISVKCMVLRVGGYRAMVLPTEEIGLERFNVEGEVAQLEAEGKTLDFLVTGTVSVPGLIGTLQTSKLPSNQRRLYRLRHELRMEITADGENWHTALVKNVSEGGLLAIDPGVPDIAPCRLVTVRLHLPDTGPL